MPAVVFVTGMTEEDAVDLYTRQIVNETKYMTETVKLYKDTRAAAEARGDGPSMKPATRVMLPWYGPLVDAIKAELKQVSLRHAPCALNLRSAAMQTSRHLVIPPSLQMQQK